ncbi:MAG: alpha/beta fold hydrolase [Thermoleophilia bacterium]
MPRLRVNGVAIHHEVRGSGPAILGIHGSLSSAALWAKAAATLATRGRAITYDRRGCNRSERPRPYATDVAQQAGDAAALIEALGAAPAILIGRSYGADIAMDLALRRPDLVRALALLEGGEALFAPGRRWLAQVEAEVLAAGPGGAAEALMGIVLGDAGWDDLPDAVRAVMAGNGEALIAEFRGGYLRAAPEDLAAIGRPVLLVAAADSPAPFAEATALLAAAMPSARVARVAGGHMIDPAHPAILAFIDEVLAPRPA